MKSVPGRGRRRRVRAALPRQPVRARRPRLGGALLRHVGSRTVAGRVRLLLLQRLALAALPTQRSGLCRLPRLPCPPVRRALNRVPAAGVLQQKESAWLTTRSIQFVT
jgi:hypothetical protein